MLPISETTLKSIAKKIQVDEQTSGKFYQVHSQTVTVCSSLVVASISDFSSFDDGHYQFGAGDDEQDGFYDRSDFFKALKLKELTVVDFGLDVIKQIHDVLTVWSKYNCEDPEYETPVVLSIVGNEKDLSRTVSLECQGCNNLFGQLNWQIQIDKFIKTDYKLIYPASELIKAVMPFAKLKEGDNPIEVLLAYPSATEQGHNASFYFTASVNGHLIQTGGLEYTGTGQSVSKSKATPIEQAIKDAEQSESAKSPDMFERVAKNVAKIKAGNQVKQDNEPDNQSDQALSERAQQNILNLFPDPTLPTGPKAG